MAQQTGARAAVAPPMMALAIWVIGTSRVQVPSEHRGAAEYHGVLLSAGDCV